MIEPLAKQEDKGLAHDGRTVLFCKSYGRDMLRAKRLVDSISRHNKDGLALFISVPQHDLAAFTECLAGMECTLLSDEQILAASAQENGPLPALFPPHLFQQLVKLEFWRLGLCENYIWIDSDSYFIRDFRQADFFFDDKTPYIMQEVYQPDTELANMNHVPRKIREKRVAENVALIERFQKLFGNDGTLWRFAGSMPLIWSTIVLQHFNEEFLVGLGKNVYEFLVDYPCETQIYGEYLHASQVIPVRPHAFLFRSFLYADEFYVSQMQGECEYSIAQDYFGICLQSNWALIQEKKTAIYRLKKHWREFLLKIHRLFLE